MLFTGRTLAALVTAAFLSLLAACGTQLAPAEPVIDANYIQTEIVLACDVETNERMPLQECVDIMKAGLAQIEPVRADRAIFECGEEANYPKDLATCAVTSGAGLQRLSFDQMEPVVSECDRLSSYPNDLAECIDVVSAALRADSVTRIDMVFDYCDDSTQPRDFAACVRDAPRT